MRREKMAALPEPENVEVVQPANEFGFAKLPEANRTAAFAKANSAIKQKADAEKKFSSTTNLIKVNEANEEEEKPKIRDNDSVVDDESNAEVEQARLAINEKQAKMPSPTKLTINSVKKTVFPENLKAVNRFEPVKLRNEFEYKK
jgi:hypothetical protein